MVVKVKFELMFGKKMQRSMRYIVLGEERDICTLAKPSHASFNDILDITLSVIYRDMAEISILHDDSAFLTRRRGESRPGLKLQCHSRDST